EKVFGIGAVVFVLIFLAAIWYLKSTIPEASLKKFQSSLDQDLIKFQNKHENQINAVHNVYQQFQKMIGIIDYIENGENFTQPIKPKEEIVTLINYRHNFKKIFRENRLLFSENLCDKIEKNIKTVDKYIETYDKGLFDYSEEDVKRQTELNEGPYIAGVWKVDEFDDILNNLQQTRTEIENEFRDIYGTTN